MKTKAGATIGTPGRALLASRHGWPQRVAVALFAGALFAPLATSALPVPSHRAADAQTIVRSRNGRYILRSRPGRVTDLVAAVAGVKGNIRRRMPSVDSLMVDLTPSQLARLKGVRSLLVAVPDQSIKTLTAAVTSSSTDPTPMRVADAAINAPAVWAAGGTGKGVCVALVDTGVAPVPGLNDGRVITGPDLSLDAVWANDATLGIDAFGHGTHLAGIIAGHDKGTSLTDPSAFVGVAPDACIVNVKVGAFNGATDVSQVIAAIDWVVENRAKYNIRVLNLSYGTHSTQDPTLDPLSWAAEVAWRSGITVVAAAGNDGGRVELSDPAYNPTILAVSAADLATDSITLFSNKGHGERKPDISAPGARIASLRVPGSFLDRAHPPLVPGDRFLRGSGTSQAAAMVSGAAALLIQQYPDATPDQVKKALRESEAKLASNGQGKGLLDVAAAAAELKSALDKNKAPKSDDFAKRGQSRGIGSLELARGGSHLALHGIRITGEVDVFGNIWDGAAWAGQAAAGRGWSSRRWFGADWGGHAWFGADWRGADWRGADWSGADWRGADWRGADWSGADWRGSDWFGADWRGADWSGADWRGADWNGADWSGADWRGADWSGADWNGADWSGLFN